MSKYLLWLGMMLTLAVAAAFVVGAQLLAWPVTVGICATVAVLSFAGVINLGGPKSDWQRFKNWFTGLFAATVPANTPANVKPSIEIQQQQQVRTMESISPNRYINNAGVSQLFSPPVLKFAYSSKPNSSKPKPTIAPYLQGERALVYKKIERMRDMLAEVVTNIQPVSSEYQTIIDSINCCIKWVGEMGQQFNDAIMVKKIGPTLFEDLKFRKDSIEAALNAMIPTDDDEDDMDDEEEEVKDPQMEAFVRSSVEVTELALSLAEETIQQAYVMYAKTEDEPMFSMDEDAVSTNKQKLL